MTEQTQSVPTTDAPRRVAVVTGGSRGIGREIAERLAADGLAVVVSYAGSQDEAEAAVAADHRRRRRGDRRSRPTSPTRRPSPALFDAAEAAFGGVDVVVHAAGVMALAPLAELDLDELDRMHRTNIRGTFVVAQQAARRVRDRRRRSSTSPRSVLALALPGYAAYAASKGAVEAMTLILARELRGRDVTVNAVAPGPTATDLFLDGKDEETVARMAAQPPLERLGTPQDIAEVVAFLAGPAGRWVNGQVAAGQRRHRLSAVSRLDSVRPMSSTTSTRTRILQVAARLVGDSPDGDISTRAVCEAAQVGAPALYRHFGDKEGLLSAVVDHGFEQYLATKREREASADPVEDLRRGWDSHVEFAVRNPNLYRLMNSPAMRTPPAAALESHRILTRDLERAAAQGRIRVAPELAAQMVMSATVGVALMLVARPATFDDPGLSRRVRDAVHASILTPDPDPDPGPGAREEAEIPSAAARLSALLRQAQGSGLSTAEAALMKEWLDRVANTGPEG